MIYIWKNALKDIKNYKLQFFITFVINLILAVLFISSLSVNSHLVSTFNNLKKTTHLHDFVISPRRREEGLTKEDISYIEYVESEYDASIYKRQEFSFKYYAPKFGQKYDRNVFSFIDQPNNITSIKQDSKPNVDYDNPEQQYINKSKQNDGSKFIASKDNKIVLNVIVSYPWAKYNHLVKGDDNEKIEKIGEPNDNTSFQLHINGLNPNIYYHIVGYINSAALFFPLNFTNAIGRLDEGAFIVFNTDDLNNLEKSMMQYSAFSKIIYTVGSFNKQLSDNEKNEKIEAISNYFAKKLNIYDWNSNDSIITLRSSSILQSAKNTKTIDLVLIGLIAVTISFLVSFIIKKRVDASRLKIGILKALGYRSLTISSSFAIYPIITSVFSFIVGSILSLWVSGIIEQQQFYQFNIKDPGNIINIKYILLGVVVFSLMFGFMAWIIALISIREKTIKLLYQKQKFSLGTVGSYVLRVFRFLPFTLRFGISIAIAAGFRTVILMGILLVGSFLIIFGFSIRTLISDSLDEGGHANNFDISYKYNSNVNINGRFNLVSLEKNNQYDINKWYIDNINYGLSLDYSTSKKSINNDDMKNEYEFGKFLELIGDNPTIEMPINLNPYFFINRTSLKVDGKSIFDSKENMFSDLTLITGDLFKKLNTPINKRFKMVPFIEILINLFSNNPTTKVNCGFQLYNPLTDIRVNKLSMGSINQIAEKPDSNKKVNVIALSPPEKSNKREDIQVNNVFQTIPSNILKTIENSHLEGNYTMHYIPALVSDSYAKANHLNIGSTLSVNSNIFPDIKKWHTLNNYKIKIIDKYKDSFSKKIIISNSSIQSLYENEGYSEFNFTKNYNTIYSQFPVNYLTGGRSNDNRAIPSQIPIMLINEKEGKLPGVALVAISDLKSLKAGIEGQVGILSFLLLMFTIGVSIIGCLSIVTLNDLIICENKSAISILQVIGYQNSKTNKIFMIVYAPITIIMYLIGIIMVLGTLILIGYLVLTHLNLVINTNLQLFPLIISFSIIIFTYLISYLVCQNQIKRVNYLKYTNN